MPRVRLLAGFGLAGAVLSVVLVGLLHVVAAAQVDPIRRTISEYALGEYRPLFDVGVLGLAVGSVLVAVALVRVGLVRRPSAAPVLLGTWALALVLVVVFEKANWSVGPSVSGYVHRYASLVAFVSLPVAALLIARGRSGAFAVWTRWLGVISLLWLGSIFLGVLLRPLTGVQWWLFLPLGVVERGLALSEVAAVVVLGLWARHAAASRPVGARADMITS